MMPSGLLLFTIGANSWNRWSTPLRGPLVRPLLAKVLEVMPVVFKKISLTALERGYASNVVLPLISGGQTLGVLLIYSSVPDSVNDDELKLLINLSNNMAYGIMALRTRQQHKEVTAEREHNLSLQQTILEATADGILSVDNEGKIISFNQKFLEIWNLPASALATRNSEDAFNIMEDQLLDPSYFRERTIEIVANIDTEFHDVLHLRNGKIVECFSYLHQLVDKTVGRVCSYRDITKSKTLSNQLQFHANHNTLTGFINRREFECRAERLLSTVVQGKGEHALCFMDLDQSKVVNDTCGHAAGDEMLRQLSSVLQNIVRHRDTL